MTIRLRMIARAWLPLPLAALAGCCCCGGGNFTPPATDPYAEVQEETENGSAVLKTSVEGSELNKFFPPQEGDFDIVFKQEKTGFAQISLQKKADGSELATMAISDTVNEPEAKDKFKDATEKLGGLPVAAQGSQGTALLVADRFQVAVRSVDPSFAEADRRAWLEKFDLAGLAQLK